MSHDFETSFTNTWHGQKLPSGIHNLFSDVCFVFLCSHVNVQNVQVLPTHLEQALAHHFPLIGSSLHSHCFRSRLCTCSSHLFTNPEFSICNRSFFGEKYLSFRLYWYFIIYFDSFMKIHLEQIKTNDKFYGKYSGFVDSEFVKTCDELVIGLQKRSGERQEFSWSHTPLLQYPFVDGSDNHGSFCSSGTCLFCLNELVLMLLSI